MRSEKLQAFILSALDYGDSDRIVSLFSLEQGRLSAFARGAKKSRKRFGAGLEPFARVEVLARLKEEGLATLQQSDPHSLYPGIRTGVEPIAYALYACELVEALTPEGQPLPRLFRLLSAYLDRLESDAAEEHDRRFFEINLLNILGYRPSLTDCSRCGEQFGSRGGLLQGGGEPLCHACAATGREIRGETLALLTASLATGTFGRISFPADCLSEAGMLLDDALAAHAGRRLKSLEFLQQVTRL